jgi:hypothetical protein
MNSMLAHFQPRVLGSLHILLLSAGILMSGCDADEEDDYDYVPPAGQGAMIVDNNTDNDIEVFVDGQSRGKVGDDSDRPFDVSPGVHRVVLDEKGGDRVYRDDIDILNGRLTVLDVDSDFDYVEYDVLVYFD